MRKCEQLTSAKDDGRRSRCQREDTRRQRSVEAIHTWRPRVRDDPAFENFEARLRQEIPERQGSPAEQVMIGVARRDTVRALEREPKHQPSARSKYAAHLTQFLVGPQDMLERVIRDDDIGDPILEFAQRGHELDAVWRKFAGCWIRLDADLSRSPEPVQREATAAPEIDDDVGRLDPRCELETVHIRAHREVAALIGGVFLPQRACVSLGHPPRAEFGSRRVGHDRKLHRTHDFCRTSHWPGPVVRHVDDPASSSYILAVFSRYRAATRRMATEPRWFVESLKLAWHRRVHARRWGDLYRPRTPITQLRGLSRPRLSFPEVPDMARAELLMFLAAQVRARRPHSVLEVGVAYGASSAVILDALAKNRGGRLTSIDLPMLTIDAAGEVGRLIPEDLRSRWDLHLGPSSQLLPRLARERSPIDLFLHDGDHTYPVQLSDFRSVWPYMRPGGLFIVDDVCNPAFEDFADEVGSVPMVAAKTPQGFFGYIEVAHP